MSVEIYQPILAKTNSASVFPVREDEPEYAKLKDPVSKEKNRYGNNIDLIASDAKPNSLNINGVDEIGPNPNRHKQHAFHFTADNCIGCHACETACSEKNDMPAHLSFRSVGYVEGGTYPNYTRMNISMACNHCDDPVCLKGCPTRAYTKHPEYGAVIQDPDICFGCGYCTWVCPYNAPQLDPIKGQVEKCNMCVDRLEVGLKPACVSACLGNALDFGVVENTPENRQQCATQIPGFPDPSITQPNIRFQQIKTLPKEVTRTDSMPIKYQKKNEGDAFKTVIDQKKGTQKYWNIKRLSSRENPLVIFTLSAQAAVGVLFTLLSSSLFKHGSLASLTTSPVYAVLLVLALALVALGLFISTVHLGKPFRFYRGFNNLKHSPVSREGLGIVLFMGFLGLHFLLTLPANEWVRARVPAITSLQGSTAGFASMFAGLALLSGLVALYYMYRCYCIKARPFWNHWHAAATFYGNMLSLGAIVCGCTATACYLLNASSPLPLWQELSTFIIAGLVLESGGLIAHARDMKNGEHEGSVSHYEQTTTFGYTYIARNTLMALNLLLATTLVFAAQLLPESLANILWILLACSIVGVALIGRSLFYILVIPTTMPGAFFWKNKGFEQHARDTGLANLPQVGVVPEHLVH
ncbi:MAG: dimethyl sulfoxide reductase anchor subunit [Pseudomonadales bacterium]|nr:dimethyl sulfoxide reductase anchor subunit [Pseudomonadales bacterium]